MKVPEYLFFLIKSLTQAEKRYFTMNSNFQAGDEKRYMQMFDTIGKMETYQEEDLLKYADGNKQKLSVNKNFLYKKILRSLRAYNERSSIDIELYNMVAEARILMQKGLFHPALKQLKKAKKLAVEYEKSLVLVEIVDLEINVTGQTIKENLHENFGTLFNDAIDTLEKYKEAIKLKRLSRELHSEFIIGKPGKPQKTYEDKVNELKLTSLEPKSFYAKSTYHNALAYYSRMHRDSEEQRKHLKAIVELWRTHPKIINTQYQQYRIYLSNYAISCLAARDYKDMEAIIAEIEKLPAKSNYEEASAFQNVEYIKLLYNILRCRFKEAVALVPDIDDNIIRFRDLINKSREVSFYYNIVLAFLALKNYKAAKEWLNKILYDPKSAPKVNVKRFAWILEIIIHDQLGNDEVIRHIYSDAKLPINRPGAHPFETLAFGHLKEITKALSGRKQLYKAFKKDLDKFEEYNYHFGMDTLSAWVEANITNMPLSEVMRKRRE